MRTVRLPQRVRTAMTTPPADDHRPALRVALGLAVPGTILLLAGRPDLLIYAVFGAVIDTVIGVLAAIAVTLVIKDG